jgi:hypothetical protein
MVESLTFCSVCFEEYDKEDRVPLLVTCGHTFCKACLTLLPEPLKCPHCRFTESRTLNDLPKNFLVYQIQAQLNPSQLTMCKHEDLKFYCKVCKYPICIECVVHHSNHGLLSLNDPELPTLINTHLEQIRSAYMHRMQECKRRKEKSEAMLKEWRESYEENRQAIRSTFAKMRDKVEVEEHFYLEKINSLFQKMCNQHDDNLQTSYKVDVVVDDEWIWSNFRKLGNIGIFNPARQEFLVRRSRNVKALNWKYSGRIDALSFKTDKEIQMTAIGVCTPYKLDKETVINEIKILRGQTTRSEVVYLHSKTFRVVVDFTNGVCKVPLETMVTICPDEFYTLYLKISGAKTFKCVDSLVSVKGRDDTKFTFANTTFVKDDESNRTDILCGPLVDFFYIRDF